MLFHFSTPPPPQQTIHRPSTSSTRLHLKVPSLCQRMPCRRENNNQFAGTLAETCHWSQDSSFILVLPCLTSGMYGGSGFTTRAPLVRGLACTLIIRKTGTSPLPRPRHARIPLYLVYSQRNTKCGSGSAIPFSFLSSPYSLS